MCSFSHKVLIDLKVNETVGKLTNGEIILAMREKKYSGFYTVNAGLYRFKRERERERERESNQVVTSRTFVKDSSYITYSRDMFHTCSGFFMHCYVVQDRMLSSQAPCHEDSGFNTDKNTMIKINEIIITLNCKRNGYNSSSR
jgi:hypothetical protein